MPKSARKLEAAEESVPSNPGKLWTCTHREDHSLIEAFDEITGERQPFAEIRGIAPFDAAQVAELIVKAVGDYGKQKDLVVDLTAALELCLASEGLSWEAEHDAEIMLNRIKAV